jgi:hypothetical protein
MRNSSPEVKEANRLELEEWETELARLQALLPVEASRDRVKTVELPALERQMKEIEESIPAISEKAEEVCVH